MPGTVKEVSATLVANTMRRPLWLSNTRSWSDWDKRANKGKTSAPRVTALCDKCLRRWSLASRISRSPGKNTKMSPEAWPVQSSSTASAMASFKSRSRDSSKGRHRISTGKVRPETMMTGAGPVLEAKCCAKRSASMVADVTTTFKSGRRGKIWRK